MLELPGAIDVGFAVKDEIVGGELLAVTVTVTDFVTEPAELPAVSV
jgi:hypothetical protein